MFINRITVLLQSAQSLLAPSLLALSFAATLCSTVYADAGQAPTNDVSANSNAKLVIIIDDIGNHLQLGKRAIELPGKLNYAVLPQTPQGPALAQYAAGKGKNKEVLLHMPMEAMGEQILGPSGLYNRLSREEFSARINHALDEIPNAVGLSNHMGSYLTQQREKMNWVMSELNQRNLYFLDSRTGSQSSAKQAAVQHNVPYLSRDFFLDHSRNAEAMQQIFTRAIANAKANGLAVIIGHPYRSTLSFLEEQLPLLDQQGISLMNVSEALDLQGAARLALN